MAIIPQKTLNFEHKWHKSVVKSIAFPMPSAVSLVSNVFNPYHCTQFHVQCTHVLKFNTISHISYYNK